MESTEFLALDLGLKRTGIARGNSLVRLAHPLMSVETEKLKHTLKDLIEQHGASGIVVGLPRSLSGHETSQTGWVRDWVRWAKGKFDLPFYFQDEALSSQVAAAGRSYHKNPRDIDAVAAAVILQDFLDNSEAERVVA